MKPVWKVIKQLTFCSSITSSIQGGGFKTCDDLDDSGVGPKFVKTWWCNTWILPYPTQLEISKILHCSFLSKCHKTKLQTVPKKCTTFPMTWAWYPSLQAHCFKWCPYLWATCPYFRDSWHWLNQFFIWNHTLKLGSQKKNWVITSSKQTSYPRFW